VAPSFDGQAGGLVNKKIMKNSLSWAILGIVFIAIIAVGSPKRNMSPERKGKFVHTVFFWMKEGATPADLAKLREGLASLRPIKEIKKMHIGTPAGTPREVVDNSYAVTLILYFDNAAAQDAYQVHPIHLKFVEGYKQLWTRVQIYDALVD
jgi:Stress responsive A/B Barrel Domain